MAPLKAPVLDAEGQKQKDFELEAAVFSADVKRHLLHEVVRAEAAAARAGTRSAKTRGQVAGGASKPWRQKGTGRARAGTIRAPQWKGGGVAFPVSRSFDLKVNRKARKAALRGALSAHVQRSALALVEGSSFGAPSTKSALAFLEGWGAEWPVVVVCQPEEDALAKSFRNLTGVLVLDPSTVEVGALVWARSLLFTEAALQQVAGRLGSEGDRA
jgi:large subunit ribosomal protein L4